MFKKILYNLATDKYRGFLFGIPKYFLYLASLLYGAGVSFLLRHHLSKPQGLGCRVISVGNITLGGTGKTALVELIAGELRKKGKKVVILSRGYKRKKKDYAMHLMSYDKMGDEPYMLSLNLEGVPVLVNKDRLRIGRRAVKEYAADTVVLDDGFQQWKIKKDLEIVTIDAACPFGNRRLLPRGILREPLSSLKRADIFMITKVNIVSETHELKDFLKQINPKAEIVEATHAPQALYKIGEDEEVFAPEMLRGRRIAVFSGIGSPESFEKLVAGLGAEILGNFRFPDHHTYSPRDLKNISKKISGKDIALLLTTQKDAVRLRQLQLTDFPLEIFFLRIELKIIKNEDGFNHRLFGL